MGQFVFPEHQQNSLSPAIPPQDQSSCVPLEQCGPLHVMWDSRYIMMNTLEVLGALQTAHCGFLGLSHAPLFRCPAEVPHKGITGQVIDGDGFDTCAGTVKLFGRDDAELKVVAIETVAQVKAVVDSVVVVGNCCWRLHRSERFRGRSKTVRPGATHTGIGTVRSIKKLQDCPRK